MLTSEGQAGIRKVDKADHPGGKNVRGFPTILNSDLLVGALVMCLVLTDAAYIVPHFSGSIANP
jgi:hypothetical protein